MRREVYNSSEELKASKYRRNIFHWKENGGEVTKEVLLSEIRRGVTGTTQQPYLNSRKLKDIVNEAAYYVKHHPNDFSAGQRAELNNVSKNISTAYHNYKAQEYRRGDMATEARNVRIWAKQYLENLQAILFPETLAQNRNNTTRNRNEPPIININLAEARRRIEQLRLNE